MRPRILYREENPENPLALSWTVILGLGSLAVSAWATYMAWQSHKRQLHERGEVPPGERILNPGESVLLLGDSIGVGLEPYLQGLLADYGAMMDSKVEVGTSARTWAARTTNQDGGYDVVLVSLGSNDIAGCYWCEEEALAIDELLGHLRARGAHVYWVKPPSFREEGLTQAQQTFVDMLTQRGLFPLQIAGPQQDVSQDPQHLHLTPQGYRTYAAQIFDALTRTP